MCLANDDYLSQAEGPVARGNPGNLQILVAGGGGLGARIAIYLSDRGDKVNLIDKDRRRCQWVSKHSDALVYNGNVLDRGLLGEAEIAKADSLIIALDNDDTAAELVRIAKRQFGVPRVLAVTKNSSTTDTIKEVGAERIVCSEETVFNEVRNILHPRGHRTLYHDGDKDCRIERVAVTGTSKVLGKKVAALTNRFARVAGLIRSGAFLFPREETELQAGDEVIVIGKVDGVDKVCKEVEADR